ncbi:Phloretin 4'-O-glucosyltransferase-like protein [Drosera capensis]
MSPPQPRFLLVTHPVQSHINPGLQFAKRLLRVGATVTFAAAISAHKRMTKGSIPNGITITAISDGYDDGFKPTDAKSDTNDYINKFKEHGSRTLGELIEKSSAEGRPITCLVYTLMIPWVAGVARKYNLPSALLWIQPAAMLNIYYYYFYGYGDAIMECGSDPEKSIELPGLPMTMRMRDIPSLMTTPNNPHSFVLDGMKEQFEVFKDEPYPRILLNTFDALEPAAMKSIQEYSLTAIGPLLPSAFLDGKDPSDKSSGLDLFKKSKDNDIEWLNTKPKASVVYVSFGSITVLSKQQMDEMARGVLDSGRPFLWVIREKEGEQERPGWMDEAEQKGMIVPWCSQVEVLSHPAIGCFVTHCGWNSTLESLASGVPMVAFPQWIDQTTNAKMIEDLWRTGVRVNVNEEGIVKRKEITRCVEVVMESQEMRRMAKRWRELAVEAAGDGGSADRNLKEFVDEVSGISAQH